jgi:4-aminobutyrate aminotransferase-like enzyme/Ser/Thr protein kinase RdoA (MazF antagonist)
VEDRPQFVLKIANGTEDELRLQHQNGVLQRLHLAAADYSFPLPVASRAGRLIETWSGQGASSHMIRLLNHVAGLPWQRASRQNREQLWRGLGRMLATLDGALAGFDQPVRDPTFEWDLRQAAAVIRSGLQAVAAGFKRSLVEGFLQNYEAAVLPLLDSCRWGVIHNDANDHNIILSGEGSELRVAGLVDFGDLVYGPYVYEVAVAAAYAMMGEPDPLGAAAAIVGRYSELNPLEEREVGVLFDLIAIRLCTTVTVAARRRTRGEDDDYLLVSELPAWALLTKMAGMDRDIVERRLRSHGELQDRSRSGLQGSEDPLLVRRSRTIGPSLSLSYREPLKIVRGYRQYLYDVYGRPYLDCVNNVAHVGHSHPKVVGTGQEQLAILNTNSRYLHDLLVTYAERLCATLPDNLSVCYFVCTGSEANELALRLARTHTGGRDVIVVEGAYHGNTSTLIDISPYKYRGPGGAGKPEWVHEVPMPDLYRGIIRHGAPNAGRDYAAWVARAASAASQGERGLAAFICEPMLGCGGQIVLPDGYLAESYRAVHEAGGVCIADEVQVGFGRVGSHFWAFETQGVVPNIVTMGKPMGNGHPLAAVVTTPEIAASFNNGMEYFNTFGGNPVSCAIGLAVLEVIEEEGLQKNAFHVGSHLLEKLEGLEQRHEIVGDVRGLGLFLGVELVRDRLAPAPAPEAAGAVVEALKARGILLSTDGPDQNVLKIKPPLVFGPEDVDYLVANLDCALEELGQPG